MDLALVGESEKKLRSGLISDTAHCDIPVGADETP
jgi:hypothetical protein